MSAFTDCRNSKDDIIILHRKNISFVFSKIWNINNNLKDISVFQKLSFKAKKKNTFQTITKEKKKQFSGCEMHTNGVIVSKFCAFKKFLNLRHLNFQEF